MRFVAPSDADVIKEYGKRTKLVVTLEENVKRGGFGEWAASVLYEACPNRPKHLNISLPDCFLQQGTPAELRAETRIDAASVTERILEEL